MPSIVSTLNEKVEGFWFYTERFFGLQTVFGALHVFQSEMKIRSNAEVRDCQRTNKVNESVIIELH